jgi:membrane protease YdiL (CAAX protease family)
MILDRIESWVIVGLSGGLVLLAELLLWQQQAWSGLLLYSLLLLLLLLYGTFRWLRPQHQLLVLTIPAVSRLMAYTLPLGELSPIFAHLVLGVPLGLTAVVFVWLLEYEWPDLRFAWQRLPYYLLLISLGGAGGLLLYQFHQPAPLAGNDPLLLFFYALILVVAMAFLEEWLFRDIMQTALTRLWPNGILAGLVVACFYTALSLSQGLLLFSLLIFILALALSWLRHVSQNLLDVCLAHGAANLVFFLILPQMGHGDMLARLAESLLFA